MSEGLTEGSDAKRVVVLGASSGLGRSIAMHAGRSGHHVALLARREKELAEACAEAGPSAVAIRCDAIDEPSVGAAIDEAADRLGGIDGLIYATGTGTVRRIEDTDAALWRRAFETNAMGAALATSAALPHLQAQGGVAAYLSSVSASLTPPWPGLASYAVSKAALDKMVEAWRIEHPSVGFTSIVVGDCGGGEGAEQSQFTANWDGELMTQLAPIWLERKYLTGSLMDVGELLKVVDLILDLGASASIPKIAVTPRPPAS